jgi:putative inorganic carbon (hco3(-)) transporter
VSEAIGRAQRRRRESRSKEDSGEPWLTPVRVENTIFCGLLGILAGLPFFYGGNRDWAWGLALSLVSLLSMLALWFLPVALRLQSVGIRKRRPWLLLFLAAWLMLHVLHCMPGLHLSADLAASFRALMKTALYIQLILLTLVLVQGHHRTRLFISVLFFIAVLHAVTASVMKLWGKAVISEYFVFGAARSMGGYVNENSFAGYLELHLALGAGLLLMGLRFHGALQQTWRQLLRDWVALLLTRKTQVRICMVLLVIALVLTSSRMGNIAFFSALLLTGSIAYFVMAHRPPALGALLVSLVLIDLLVVGSWFGADQIAARLAATRLELGAEQSIAPAANASTAETVATTPLEVDRERPGLARAGLRLFQRAPWFGHGAGSFRALFPSVRSLDISSKFYDHAHNDFVQLLVEYGIVGALLALALLTLALRAAISCLRNRSDKVALGLAFASLFGMSSLLIHGVADFNFQIPANASTFSVLLALAWISRYGLREAASSDRKIQVSLAQK